MKKNLLLAVLSFISIQCCYSQSAGFNQTYIIINNTYYDLNATTANPDFNGANLGSFCQGATTGLTFKGAEHNNWKCGGCDITSTRILYNIHLTGAAVGTFVSNNIPYTSDFANGCGGRDQKWSKTDYSTNLLSGLAAGNYTIEVYSEESTSCSGTVYASNGGANYKASFTITTPTVASITGDTAVCVNSSTTLANATPGGVWSNSGTNATIFQSGNLFVNGAGSFTVYYTVTDGNGCSNVASKIIVPGTLPVVAAITGDTNVCVNGSTTLACATPGGVWSNSGTNATIFQSGNLFVNGSGSFTVYYTVTGANGCTKASSQIIVPGTLPTVAAITGNTNVCVNGSTTLACATPGGVWSNSGTNATVGNTGNVQVNGAGSFTVYYTVTGGNGCSNNSSVILVPSQPTSSTTNKSICPGGSYSFNGTTYTNAGTYVAHLNNSAGCDSAATLVLTMLSAIPTITGASSICVGSTASFSNSISGGVWSSSLTDMASINSSGILTGKNAGTTVVKYVLSTGSCTGTVTKIVTVNAIPNVPTITYAAGTSNPQLGAPTGAFCVGKTFNVVGSPAGGTWSATGAASVTAGGSVTINAVGAGSIKYIYTNAAGCANSRTMMGTGFTCAARGLSSNNEKLLIGNDFSIYPNPAHSFINLNVDAVIGSGSVVIADLYGKQIKTQLLSMGTNVVDIARLPKGLYFVSIITTEGKNTKKLIVE